MDEHDGCDYYWRAVSCDRCGRGFVSTPDDALHCAPSGGHLCTRCFTFGCPACGKPPRMVVNHAALCSTDDCRVMVWDTRENPDVVAAIVRSLGRPQ